MTSETTPEVGDWDELETFVGSKKNLVVDNGYDITQARLHRKTLCYSRVRGNAETLDQIVATLPQVLGCADSSMIHGII